MSNVSLKIALAKGVLLKPSYDRLIEAGYQLPDIFNQPRKLIFPGELSLIIARPTDVPVYVEHGAADLGFVGNDILLEYQPKVIELLDLKYGQCSFVLAQPKAKTKAVNRKTRLGQLTIATKYPQVTKAYLEKKGLQAEIIKLYGSIELAPLTGLADQLVDLMSTGNTLAANNLEVVDVIEQISCRLIVNEVSYRLKSRQINEFVARLKKTVKTGEEIA